MTRFDRLLASATAAVAVLAVPGIACAQFAATGSARATVATHILGAASAVQALDCPGDGKADRKIAVTWVPSPDAVVTGYTVTVTPTDGSTSIVTSVPGRSTTTVSIPVAHRASYTVTVAAAYQSWTSTPAAAPRPANC
ncbi:MAG TPA: hypothetical protein VFH38_04850 [Jatrophihabitans sp.]|nr:hypothetical protein [Jatrophihabitans sp.]